MEESRSSPISGTLLYTTGILGFIGFIMIGLTVLLFNIELLRRFPGVAKIGPIAGVLVAVTGFILGVFILLSVLSIRMKQPYRWLKITAIIWAVLLMIISILTTIYAAAGAGKVDAFSLTSLNLVALIGSIIVLVSVIILKPSLTGGGFINGSILLILGLVLLYAGSTPVGGLNSSAYIAGASLVHGLGIVGLESLITLTSPLVLIGLIIVAFGIALAPYYRRLLPRLVEYLTLIGFLVSSIGILNKSVLSLKIYYELIRGSFNPTLLKASGVTGLIAALIMIITSLLIIILSTMGLNYLAGIVESQKSASTTAES